LELGEWESRDQMLLVVVTRTRRLDYDSARPILFAQQDGTIRARDYDKRFYGPGGMVMTEVDVPAQPLLSETTWRLTRLEYAGELYQPAEGSTYTVTFAENGTLNARADCNRVTGLYSDLASFLTLSSLVATEAACEGRSFSDEYVAALRATRSYEVVAGTLVFSGDNGLLAQFETM
jgi:heat shock protein HslJ